LNKMVKKQIKQKKIPVKKAFNNHEEKLLLAGGISILLIGFFVVLFLFSPTATGRAADSGTFNPSLVYNNQVLTLSFSGNEPISSIYFEIEADGLYKICTEDNHVIVTGLDGFSFQECDGEKFVYGIGSIDVESLSDTITLELALQRAVFEGDIGFDLIEFSAFGAQSGEDLFTGFTATSLDVSVDSTGDSTDDVSSDGSGDGSGDSADDGSGDGSGNESGDSPGDGVVVIPGTSSSGSSSSSSSGGGRRATYECGTWGFCRGDLTQERTCVAIRGRGVDRIETQKCELCQESWTCREWSSCTGTQTRTCIDEHQCGTALYKPAEQRSCNVLAPPTRSSFTPTTPTYTPPSKPAQVQKPKSGFSAMWEDNKTLVIAIPSGVIFVLLVLFVVLFVIKHHKGASNLPELTAWIKSGRAKGSTDVQLKASLQGTTWSDKDIKIAFKKVK
jgi:hypothetical protein